MSGPYAHGQRTRGAPTIVVLDPEPRHSRAGQLLLQLLACGGGVCAGYAMIWFGSRVTDSMWLSLITGVGGFALTLIVVAAIYCAGQFVRARRIVAAARDRDPYRMLERVLSSVVLQGTEVPPALGLALESLVTRQGVRNVVITDPDGARLLDQVEPLRVPFEPRPLDDTDETLHSLRLAVDPHFAADDAAARRRWRRRLTRYGPAGLALMIAVMLVWRQQWLTLYIVGGLAAVALSLWLVWSAGVRMMGMRSGGVWAIVPAGLLVLRPRGGRWQPHVIGRRDAILVILSAAQVARWLVCVRDAGGLYTRRLTSSELNMLLAAWLSPLMPPTDEALSDLRGSSL